MRGGRCGHRQILLRGETVNLAGHLTMVVVFESMLGRVRHGEGLARHHYKGQEKTPEKA